MGRVPAPRWFKGAALMMMCSVLMGGMAHGALVVEGERPSAPSGEGAVGAGGASDGGMRGEPLGDVVGEEEGAMPPTREFTSWMDVRARDVGMGPLSWELSTLLPIMPAFEGDAPRILPRIYYREGPDEVFGPGNVHYLIRGHETIVELAMTLGMGFNELYAPNRNIPVWVPEAGTVVETPLLWVLPRAIERSDIVINLPEMRLYHRLPDGSVESFSVGIGREGFDTPLGKARVTHKKKDPTWIVPESILKEDPSKPKIVKPGPENPLGDRAIYLTLPGYRIHGTNQPYGLGRRVSHGCIRLYPVDIRHLFETVLAGDKVNFVDETVKAGWLGADLYLEVHEPLTQEVLNKLPTLAAEVVREAMKRRADASVLVDWDRVKDVARKADGVATPVGSLLLGGEVNLAESGGISSVGLRVTADLIVPYQHMQPVDRSQFGKDLAVSDTQPVFTRRLLGEEFLEEPKFKPGSAGGMQASTPLELPTVSAPKEAPLPGVGEKEGGAPVAEPPLLKRVQREGTGVGLAANVGVGASGGVKPEVKPGEAAEVKAVTLPEPMPKRRVMTGGSPPP